MASDSVRWCFLHYLILHLWNYIYFYHFKGNNCTYKSVVGCAHELCLLYVLLLRLFFIYLEIIYMKYNWLTNQIFIILTVNKIKRNFRLCANKEVGCFVKDDHTLGH